MSQQTDGAAGRDGRRQARASGGRSGVTRSGTPRARGRPTLGEAGGCSPRVVFRVPGELKLALQERARHTGRLESDLAREALERFLAQEK